MNQNTWPDLVGQRVGDYCLWQWLGAGRSGSTFLAEPLARDLAARRVTIKLVPIEAIPLHQQTRWYGTLELHHPHLLRLYDLGTCLLKGQGFFCQVSEWGDRSLADELCHGPLRPERARLLVRHVAAGLQHLHSHDRVHGDLSPANLIWGDGIWRIADYGEQRSVRLVESGDARLLHVHNPYAPPEASLGKVGPAWDIWALGKILEEAFRATGEPDEEERSHRFPSRREALSAPFDGIVAACLQPNPARRPTATQLLHSLPEDVAPEEHLPAPSPSYDSVVVAGFGGEMLRGMAAPESVTSPRLAFEEWMERISAEPAAPANEEPVPQACEEFVSQEPAAVVVEPAPVPARTRSREPRWLAVPAFLLLLAAATAYWPSQTPTSSRTSQVVLVPRATSSEPVVVPTPTITESAPEPSLPAQPVDETHVVAPPMAEVATSPRPIRRASVPLSRASIVPRKLDQSQVQPLVVMSERERAQAQEQIEDVVQRWAKTTRRRDLRGHLANYAPQMDRFYLRQGVNLAQVQQEKGRVFQAYTDIRTFDVQNLRMDLLTRDRAVVSFDKEWDAVGRARHAGAARSQLSLRQVDGQWRIAGERDLRVYWNYQR